MAACQVGRRAVSFRKRELVCSALCAWLIGAIESNDGGSGQG